MKKWFVLALIIVFALSLTGCGKKQTVTEKPKVTCNVEIVPGDEDEVPTLIKVTNTSSFAWHNVRIAYNNKYIYSKVIDDSNPNAITYGTNSIAVVQASETLETNKADYRSQKAGTSTEEVWGITVQCDEGIASKTF